MTLVNFVFDAVDDKSQCASMFIRRLGMNHAAGSLPCASGQACPDILELETGDFAVIGADITANADQLPPGSGCGPGERMVRVPRALLVRARADIPVAL